MADDNTQNPNSEELNPLVQDNSSEKKKEAAFKNELKKDVSKKVLKGELEHLKKDVPVNPFEQEVLPNSAMDDVQDMDEDEVPAPPKEEDFDNPPPPINPFEISSSADSSLDSKFLDEKPLDRRDFTIDTNPFESAKEEEKDEQEAASESSEDQSPIVVDANIKQRKPEDNEFKPSGAEVVDISESDQQPNLSEVQANLAAQGDDFSEDLWDILEQAGLTKKRLLIILVTAVLAICLVFGYLFGWFDFLFSNSGGQKQPEQSQVDTEQTIDPAFSIISSYIFGLQYSSQADKFVAVPITGFSGDEGIDANLVFGLDEPLPEDVFVEYVSLLSDLRNVYNTDIYNYLDKSTDRRQRLEALIEQMSKLNTDCLAIFDRLGADLLVLDVNIQEISDERDLYEQEFFRLIGLLEGNSSYKIFSDFLILENRTVSLKGTYGAYNALHEMFRSALELTIPRLEDIKANKEALIEGIRVFDVPGSDIQSILPLPLEFSR